MSRWPVVHPQKDKSTLHMNLGVTDLPSPLTTFDGPLNLLIALQGVAQGAVEVSKTKEAYTEIPPPPTEPVTDPMIEDDDDEPVPA